MQANREVGKAIGWVDVSHQAAGHGLDGQVCISLEAWRDAVYAVSEASDRLDPVRENWRMNRLLEEVSSALAHENEDAAYEDFDAAPFDATPREFTLALHEGFDRLRSLALPAARLKIRVERDHDAPEVWVDVECARTRAALEH